MKFRSLSFLLFLFSVSSYSQTSQDVNSILSNYSLKIIQNGGSISTSDLAAVSRFVTAAKAHLYYDKLIDVGPMAGNNINAALVKLKFPVNGSFLIENAGFSAADYTADLGFQLNGSKAFNTKTNLSTLNLQGLFGFSMWLSNGASSWIGSPNDNTPYSVLMANPTNVTAYIDDAGSGGGVSQADNAFYHVVKQSLTSTKVIVNGNQVGPTDSELTSIQLRNADVEVFKGANNQGRGMFYCIDNGTMTDGEGNLFYADVRQLMYDLGRKIAPPAISANGSYTATQTVSISEMPTTSSMAGATIYYTIDGSLPTINSPVYTTPITVSATTHIQAMAVKSGKLSKPASSWVAIVPVGFTTNKYYTAHIRL